MTSLWPLFNLKFGQTRILFRPAETNLGPLCVFRYLTSVLSRPACVSGGVAENQQRAHPPGLSPRLGSVWRHPWVFSLIWFQQFRFSICSSWRRRAKIIRVGAYCSALEFWRKISAKTRLLQTCLILHRRGGWDSVSFICLKIGNATGEKGCLCRKAWSLADMLMVFML